MVNSLNWVSIPLQEVISNDYRLEAGCYNVEAIRAKKILEGLKIELKHLCGKDGIAQVSYPNRFKRIYVKKSDYPLILPSQIMDVHVKPVNYMSKKTLTSFQGLQVGANELLLTRSGTIGKIRYTTGSLKNLYLSDDIIRIKSENQIDAAYIYAFMRTDIGQTLLSAKPYGAVIKHIEPEHLNRYLIPYPYEKIRREIGENIVKSFELRDKGNALIDNSERLLIQEIDLPPLEDIESHQFDENLSVKNFSISSKQLNERLDAAYHDPIIEAIDKLIHLAGAENVPLGDKRLSRKVILPGRFKRVYVEKDSGTVFLGGKQIYEIDPYNKKYLSITKHGDRIANQLYLHENMIAITCSGTIGRVNIIPKHWENWTMSQHVIRILASNNDIAGYLYIWLNSEYGRVMLERFSYGAVIKEIDNKQLANMSVPIIQNKTILKQINDSALMANKLRSEAYYLEQEAINQVNNLLNS